MVKDIYFFFRKRRSKKVSNNVFVSYGLGMKLQYNLKNALSLEFFESHTKVDENRKCSTNYSENFYSKRIIVNIYK